MFLFKKRGGVPASAVNDVSGSSGDDWIALSHNCEKFIKNGDYGLYRNERFTMSSLLAKEGKYEHALYLMCEVWFWDLSCLGNGYADIASWNPAKRGEAIGLLRLCGLNYITAPGVVNCIRSYQKSLSWSDDELLAFIEKSLSDFSAPFHPFKKDECFQLIAFEIKGDSASASSVFEKVNKRFCKKYRPIV